MLDYFSKKDNNIKILFFKNHLDEILYQCGIISVNTLNAINYKTKYYSSTSFTTENLFQEEIAEEVIADEIIKLFDFCILKNLNKSLTVSAMNNYPFLVKAYLSN